MRHDPRGEKPRTDPLRTARPEKCVVPQTLALAAAAVPLVSGLTDGDTGEDDAPEGAEGCSSLLVDTHALPRTVAVCGLECLTITGTSKIRTYTSGGDKRLRSSSVSGASQVCVGLLSPPCLLEYR